MDRPLGAHKRPLNRGRVKRRRSGTETTDGHAPPDFTAGPDAVPVEGRDQLAATPFR